MFKKAAAQSKTGHAILYGTARKQKEAYHKTCNGNGNKMIIHITWFWGFKFKNIFSKQYC